MERSPQDNEEESAEHETIRKIESLLENNDFSSSYIRTILTRARNEFTLEDLENYDHVQDTVVNWIGESIQIADTRSSVRPRVRSCGSNRCGKDDYGRKTCGSVFTCGRKRNKTA